MGTTMFLGAFTICFCISSVLNLLFKMNKKRDWLITLLLSLVLALIFTPFMMGGSLF
ncbi:hypothetical protein [Ornithinibacillus sp. 179-J 7C1 HS]|uniref:hypothetical protein n=1 Tax=Ornithinibacillus sp. 179-J 7C1 HS TaxID=3142384 RepID=UPI0039A0ACAE